MFKEHRIWANESNIKYPGWTQDENQYGICTCRRILDLIWTFIICLRKKRTKSHGHYLNLRCKCFLRNHSFDSIQFINESSIFIFYMNVSRILTDAIWWGTLGLTIFSDTALFFLSHTHILYFYIAQAFRVLCGGKS